jgi:hypothetical protein
MPKTDPIITTLAAIEDEFELVSYRWFDGKWCPAVYGGTVGYGIRVLMSRRTSNLGRDTQESYDYFELDADGVITKSPRGYAKAYNRLRVRDIDDAVTKYAQEDPTVPAMRI